MDVQKPKTHTYIIAIDTESSKDLSREDITDIMIEQYGILSIALKNIPSKVEKWTVFQFSIDLYDHEVF